MAAFSRGRQLCLLSSHTLQHSPLLCPQYMLPFQQLLHQSTSSKPKIALSQPSNKKTNPLNVLPATKAKAKAIPLKASYDSTVPNPTPFQHPVKPWQERISSAVSNPRLTGLSPAAINPRTLHTLLDVPEKIYQSEPHKLYIFSSYTLASFFMLYGGSTSMMWTSPPDGLHWTVPVAYGISSIALVAVGSYTLSNTTGLVQSITALPVKGSNKVDLKIVGSKWAPWRTKSVTCKLGDCYFDNGIEATVASSGGRGERTPLTEVNVFVRPWVWMGRGILDFFLETKSMFLREHMVGLIVEDGGKWKVDVRGMALGGAEGLDRLIHTERDRSRMSWLVQAGLFVGSVTVVYMLLAAYRTYRKEEGEKEKELSEKAGIESV